MTEDETKIHKITTQDFRWVKAQQECSPFEVFKLLQKGCERDVEDRKEIRPKEPVAFKVSPQGDSFLVLREGNRISSSIEFRWLDSGITVCDNNSKPILEAAVIVNDDGECRLKVGNEELTFWQFRRRALHDLFFKFKLSP